MSGLIGRKIGMTSIFDDNGKNIPCTVIEVGPCVVTQVRTKDVDGYDALQLGFDDKAEKQTTKALKGHFKKAGTTAKSRVAEFQGFDEEYKLGDTITVEHFNEGEFVDIAGLVAGASKGEGLGNRFLASIREVGVLVHVVRCFENPDIIHVNNKIDPAGDIEIIDIEHRYMQGVALIGAVSGKRRKVLIEIAPIPGARQVIAHGQQLHCRVRGLEFETGADILLAYEGVLAGHEQDYDGRAEDQCLQHKQRPVGETFGHDG